MGDKSRNCPICSCDLVYLYYGHWWSPGRIPYIYFVVGCLRPGCPWKGRAWYEIIEKEGLIFRGLTPRAVKEDEAELTIPGEKEVFWGWRPQLVKRGKEENAHGERGTTKVLWPIQRPET